MALFLIAAVCSASLSVAQCQLAKLSAEDGEYEDRFGWAVAVAGDVAMVAMPWDDDYEESSGAVYVFQRQGGDWEATQKLPVDDPDMGPAFGSSLGLDGDVAVIGAVSRGVVHVFERFGDIWIPTATLRADDGEPRHFFGWSADISGDTIVVGAPGGGAAYVFERVAQDSWVQVAKLLPDGSPFIEFGHAVAISAGVVVVGSPDDDEQGNYSGAAYVYERQSDGLWTQTAKLLAEDGGPFDSFGDSVAVRGSRVLIGASFAGTFGMRTGAAYVFERVSDGSWVPGARLAAADGASHHEFGKSVALSANFAVIGAWQDEERGVHSGSVYVFACDVTGAWWQAAKLVGADTDAGDRFGNAVAVSANIAVIGAYKDDDHGMDSGSAYIFAVGPDDDGDGVMDACECPGDLNKDWIVNYNDLIVLLADWGCTTGDCPGDIDADGDTDHADLGILLAHWGEGCP